MYVLTIEYKYSYTPITRVYEDEFETLEYAPITNVYEDEFETLEEAEKAKAFFIEEREGNGDIIISEDIEQI